MSKQINSNKLKNQIIIIIGLLFAMALFYLVISNKTTERTEYGTFLTNNAEYKARYIEINDQLNKLNLLSKHCAKSKSELLDQYQALSYGYGDLITYHYERSGTEQWSNNDEKESMLIQIKYFETLELIDKCE